MSLMAKELLEDVVNAMKYMYHLELMVMDQYGRYYQEYYVYPTLESANQANKELLIRCKSHKDEVAKTGLRVEYTTKILKVPLNINAKDIDLHRCVRVFPMPRDYKNYI